MLVIRAISFKGQPVPRELSARYAESGGTIGRSEHSTLVLPDPERYISRTHATIAFQAGGFVITDNGTKNPILLNGRPLGSGSQGRLASGDHIKLGDYVLEVALTPVRIAGVGDAPPGGPVKDDPLAAFGGPAPAGSDPFQDLLPPPAEPAPAPVTPADVDPRIAQASPVPPVAQLPANILDILRGPEPKIDDVYDLRSSPRSDVLTPEPEPGHPLGPSSEADPFAPSDV